MTVSSTTNKIVYAGSAGQTVFAYNFRVDLKTDMIVYLGGIPIGQGAWTITGLGNAGGGNVTLNVPLAVDTSVSLVRELPLTQLTDYQPFDAFPAETHEDALDTLTMITQQLQELIDRNPVPPPDNVPGDLLVPGNLTVAGAGNFVQGAVSGVTPPTLDNELVRKDYVDAAILGAVPVGGIIMFSGTYATIPVNFQICDGTNGTPNLVDKFVLGTATQAQDGDLGGFADIPVISHTHPEAGDHTHDVLRYNTFNTRQSGGSDQAYWRNSTTVQSGSSGAHTHAAPVGAISGTGRNIPPYLKLAYIRRMT